MPAWNRQAWSLLTTAKKNKKMAELGERLPAGFEWLRTETFERFGRTTETGVFAYRNREFVFVPGDTATVGWAGPDQDPAGEPTALSGIFEQRFGLSAAEADAHLKRLMSPLREVAIGPMLVERRTSSAGWYPFSIEELDEEDTDILEEIERFRSMPEQSLEIHQYLRLERIGEEIRLELFDDSETFEEWTEGEIEDGFDLLTEDEWEALYGAGARTLFPWGDDIDDSMRLKHFDRAPHELERPNGLGLCFPGDPYQKELVRTPGGYAGKGGDGGSHIHGGLGRFLGYLPVATAFRDPNEHELEWADLLDCLVYRRIVRL